MRQHAIHFDGPGRTKQSFRDECDINYMLRTYQNGGKPPANNLYPAQYGDFSGATDLHTSLNQVREAEAAFMQLPSKIRSKFRNDPGELLDFLADDANASEAADLGLIERPDPDQVDPAPEPEPPAPEPDPEPSPEGE